MSAWRALWLLPALGVFSLVAPACQAIAGIEDRTYSDAGSAVVVTPACRKYCDTIEANCVDFPQYETDAECLGICSHLAPGDDLEPTGNTLACRQKQAEFAGSHGEPDVDCPAAGPGGNGTCGTNCQSFCALQASICPPGEMNCEALCPGLVGTTTFTSDQEQGDSLACRIYHVSAASVAPDPHCMHATLRPNGPCLDPDGTAPSCDAFCQLEMTVCTGADTVYESNAECHAVCMALDPGTTNDHTQNTAGCRFYHSYNALSQPDIHCGHTGPGGDGHCGIDDATAGTGNCVSYCKLANEACSTQFSQAFGDAASCITTCGGLPGAAHDSGYSLMSSGTGNSVQCRLFHVARALLTAAGNDPVECPAVFGGAPCD